MKTLYKTILLVFLIFAGITAEANERKGKFTETKEISNSYAVSSNFNLVVNNAYGEVKVETWDKNEVSYHINIISNGDNLDRVKERLDDISVSIDESKSKLSLVTRIKHRKNDSSTFTAFVKGLFSGDNVFSKSSHIEINYIIHLPREANLDLTNDYGYIYIDETKGNTRINSDYGGVIAEALLSSSNVINLDYSSKSDIVHLRQAEMNLGYSSIHLHHVGYLDLVADYCTTKIDSIKDMTYNIDYGSISINKSRKIEGNADYVQVKIGEVEDEVNLVLSYGGVKINRMKKGFTNAMIHADYASVKIGVDYEEEFQLNISTDYASIKGIQSFETIYKNDDDFRGYNKNKNSSKHISIDADYGSVSIFRAD